MARMGFSAPKLRSLSDRFTNNSTEVQDKVTKIFDSIESMSADWSGGVFDSFAQKMRDLRTNSFEDVKAALNKMASQFDAAAKEAQRRQSSMIDLVK